MNRGLLLKSIRETWLTTLLFGSALLAVEALLAYILPSFYDEIFTPMGNMPFIQNLAKALLGIDVGPDLGPRLLGALAWVHPVPLALLWAQEIVFCTRVPAGEVDRGTVDVLLGLPVSRWELYFSESMVCVAAALGVLAMGLLGNVLGGLAVEPTLRQDVARVCMVLINLLCMYIAVAGLAFLVSALSNRRGRAMGTVFGIVVASFLLNFLAQFWQPAENVSWLSVLHYYQPLAVLRDGIWPMKDIVVLASCGVALWLAGGVVFSRRQICTL